MVRISFEHLAQVNSRLAFFLRNRRRVTLVRPRRAAPPAARARPRPPPRPRRSTASQSGRAPSCRTCRTDTRIGNFLIKGALTFPHSRRKLQKGCNDSASLSHPESNLVPKESVWIRCLLSEVACLKQSPSRWSRLKSTFCQSWEFESLLFPQNHCSPKMLPPEKAEQSPAAAVLSIETCCVAGLLRRRPMSQLFVRWQHARRLQRVPLLCMSAVWAGFYFCVTATQYAQCCSLSVIWGHMWILNYYSKPSQTADGQRSRTPCSYMLMSAFMGNSGLEPTFCPCENKQLELLKIAGVLRINIHLNSMKT